MGDEITRQLAALPPHLWAESLRRMEVVNRYLDLEKPTTADADRSAAELQLVQRSFFRLAAAVRDLRAGGEAKHRERQLVARLYEIPRVRQVTGNVVHLHTDEPEAIEVSKFIAHDLAAPTMLDNEILAPRLPIDQSRKGKKPRDRRDAGHRHEHNEGQQPARRSTRTRRVSGSYE